VKREEKRGK
jgi:hypothetical protein